MQGNQLGRWLTPFKATAAGQSLCALENRPDFSAKALLQINSKAVRAGDVFLAIEGVTSHGKQFIRAALAQGAA